MVVINKYKETAEQLITSKDNILKSAINEKIGDNWDVEDLKGRMSIIIKSGVENAYLDNELLIVLYPVRHAILSNKVTFVQDYRVLARKL